MGASGSKVQKGSGKYTKIENMHPFLFGSYIHVPSSILWMMDQEEW